MQFNGYFFCFLANSEDNFNSPSPCVSCEPLMLIVWLFAFRSSQFKSSRRAAVNDKDNTSKIYEIIMQTPFEI